MNRETETIATDLEERRNVETLRARLRTLAGDDTDAILSFVNRARTVPESYALARTIELWESGPEGVADVLSEARKSPERAASEAKIAEAIRHVIAPFKTLPNAEANLAKIRAALFVWAKSNLRPMGDRKLQILVRESVKASGRGLTFRIQPFADAGLDPRGGSALDADPPPSGAL